MVAYPHICIGYPPGMLPGSVLVCSLPELPLCPDGRKNSVARRPRTYASDAPARFRSTLSRRGLLSETITRVSVPSWRYVRATVASSAPISPSGVIDPLRGSPKVRTHGGRQLSVRLPLRSYRPPQELAQEPLPAWRQLLSNAHVSATPPCSTAVTRPRLPIMWPCLTYVAAAHAFGPVQRNPGPVHPQLLAGYPLKILTRDWVTGMVEAA